MACDSQTCLCNTDPQNLDGDNNACTLGLSGIGPSGYNVNCDSQQCTITCRPDHNDANYLLELQSNYPALYTAIQNLPYNTILKDAKTVFDFAFFYFLMELT